MTIDVRICVVGSAEGAVAVLTTSLADSRSLELSAAADDEIAEEIEDATEDVMSSDVELGIVV